MTRTKECKQAQFNFHAIMNVMVKYVYKINNMFDVYFPLEFRTLIVIRCMNYCS